MKPDYLSMESVDEEFMDIKSYLDNKSALISEMEKGLITEDEAKVTILGLNGITQEDLVAEGLEIDIIELVNSFDTGANERLSRTSTKIIDVMEYMREKLSEGISAWKMDSHMFEDAKDTYNIRTPEHAWFVIGGYKEVAENITSTVAAIRATFGKDFVSSTAVLSKLEANTNYGTHTPVEINKAQYKEMAIVMQDALSLMTTICECDDAEASDIPAKLSLQPGDEYINYVDMLLHNCLLPLYNYALFAIKVREDFYH